MQPRWRGFGFLLFGVPGEEAFADVAIGSAGADGLLIADPELAEFSGTGWDIGDPDVVIGNHGKSGKFFYGFHNILPTTDGHATT